MENGYGPSHNKHNSRARRLHPYPMHYDDLDSEPPVCNILSLYVLFLFIIFIIVYVCYYLLSPSKHRIPGVQDIFVDQNNVVFHGQVYTHRINDIILKSQIEWKLKYQKFQKKKPVVPVKTHLCRTESLEGPLSVNASHSHDDISLGDVIDENSDLQFGGKWQPADCYARYRVAVIIPYRDRLHHLVVLLSHLLPILMRQQLNFRVFVVEQYGNATFNKGRIMNAAYKEALKMFDFQCVVFHDVDLIPEDDRNMYSCPWQPRHMSVAIDEMDYRLKYDILVGGVLNLRVDHFQMLNGYSNMYWGWGAEDDDMAYRILHVGLKITRPPSTIARYQMIKHQKRRPTSWHTRSKLLHTAVKRFKMDGLNSVNYKLMFIHEERLFTHIMVDIGKP